MDEPDRLSQLEQGSYRKEYWESDGWCVEWGAWGGVHGQAWLGCLWFFLNSPAIYGWRPSSNSATPQPNDKSRLKTRAESGSGAEHTHCRTAPRLVDWPCGAMMKAPAKTRDSTSDSTRRRCTARRSHVEDTRQPTRACEFAASTPPSEGDALYTPHTVLPDRYALAAWRAELSARVFGKGIVY